MASSVLAGRAGPSARDAGTFGMHLTLDGYDGDPRRLGDVDVVRAWLADLPARLGMNKLTEPCLVEVGPQNVKDPGGVTGFVLIAQSHLSVHTFPRRGFVTADIFTCQEHLDHEGIRDALIQTFGLESVETNLLERGTRYPLANLPDHAARAGAPAQPVAISSPGLSESAASRAWAPPYGMPKDRFLKRRVEHLDIRAHDTRALVEAFAGMSFSARDLARATAIYRRMLNDPNCTIILTIAGSAGAAGCLQLFPDLVEHGMVDIVVATGAAVVDMDFLEALGFGHYHGSSTADDQVLRAHRIDRIYDTYIDDEELQACDRAVQEVADGLPPGAYSSRAFIREMGRWLAQHPERAKKPKSLVQTCFEQEVPVFCPAFSDSCAGFGLVAHQITRPDDHVMIDSVRDFRELTGLKIAAAESGVVIVGGGTPKNFALDTVTCAEVLGHPAPVHKYSIQITVADVRDGACSSSTLKEAGSYGKVGASLEQMVFAEATLALPLMAGALYHDPGWQPRARRRLNRQFEDD